MLSHIAPSPFDEKKFSIKYGFYVDGDVLFIPYTNTEEKLLHIAKTGSEELTPDERMTVNYYHKYLPHLFGFGFGLLGALCMWKLDTLVVNFNNKRSTGTSYSKIAEEAAKAQENANSPEAEILKAANLSKKQLKTSSAAHKYDYLKAAQNMAKEGPAVEPYKLKGGRSRYFYIFSVFYTLGLVHGASRCRVYLYNYSKKFEKKLEDYVPGPLPTSAIQKPNENAAKSS